MRRRGFTLVEVVVVIFIIVVAIGLLLPARQRCIGSSTRMQTNNNLKQCALAIHAFHDNYKKLPDGCGLGGIYPSKNGSLWIHLLPFVEANNVYTAGFDNWMKATIPPYCAPSDPYNEDSAGTVNFAANVRILASRLCAKPTSASMSREPRWRSKRAACRAAFDSKKSKTVLPT